MLLEKIAFGESCCYKSMILQEADTSKKMSSFLWLDGNLMFQQNNVTLKKLENESMSSQEIQSSLRTIKVALDKIDSRLQGIDARINHNDTRIKSLEKDGSKRTEISNKFHSFGDIVAWDEVSTGSSKLPYGVQNQSFKDDKGIVSSGEGIGKSYVLVSLSKKFPRLPIVNHISKDFIHTICN